MKFHNQIMNVSACVCWLFVYVCWGWGGSGTQYIFQYVLCFLYVGCLLTKNDSDLWHISLELHFLNMVSVIYERVRTHATIHNLYQEYKI